MKDLSHMDVCRKTPRQMLPNALELASSEFVDLDLAFREDMANNHLIQYALSLGLLYMEFCDSIHKSNGNRIL